MDYSLNFQVHIYSFNKNFMYTKETPAYFLIEMHILKR